MASPAGRIARCSGEGTASVRRWGGCWPGSTPGVTSPCARYKASAACRSSRRWATARLAADACNRVLSVRASRSCARSAACSFKRWATVRLDADQPNAPKGPPRVRLVWARAVMASPPALPSAEERRVTSIMSMTVSVCAAAGNRLSLKGWGVKKSPTLKCPYLLRTSSRRDGV